MLVCVCVCVCVCVSMSVILAPQLYFFVYRSRVVPFLSLLLRIMASNNGISLPVRNDRSRSPPRSPTIADAIHEICVRGCAYVNAKDITKEQLRECLRATVKGVMASQRPGAHVADVARAGRLSHSLFPNRNAAAGQADHQ